MGQTALHISYELDEQQSAEIIALARQRNAEPEQLVREAVAKYLVNVEYEARRNAALTSLKHPVRDNRMFGAWHDSGVDGVEYQSDLRSE